MENKTKKVTSVHSKQRKPPQYTVNSNLPTSTAVSDPLFEQDGSIVAIVKVYLEKKKSQSAEKVSIYRFIYF